MMLEAYHSDAPLTDAAEDRFNRWPFAARIASALATRQDPTCIVVGIDGAWGEGKTTVLNFVEAALKSHANVVCLRFNPWRFPAEEALLSGFYEGLAKAIDWQLRSRSETTASFAKKYGGPFAALLGKRDAVNALADLVGHVSVAELRARIESALEEAGKRVVVLVDDIDRLERAEIHAVFRLVKLNADLRHTGYVLAFDQDAVADALGAQFGDGGTTAGHEFLEKIIQVPLALPPCDKGALRQFCIERVDAALSESGISIAEADAQSFELHFTRGLECRLETPRMAVRYGNILTFALPLLKNEVHPVDQLLLEGMRVFFPRMYQAVRSNRDTFLGRAYTAGQDESQYRDAVLGVVKEAADSLSLPHQAALKHLLSALFPRTKGAFGNTRYGSEWDQTWSTQQRIASRDYFDRFFSYAVRASDVADAQVSALLDAADAGNAELASSRYHHLLKPETVDSFLAKLRHRANEVSAEGAEILATCVARQGHSYEARDSHLSFEAPCHQAAILVANLLKRIPQGADRVNAIERLLGAAQPLAFTAECLRWITVTSDPPGADDLTPDAQAAIRLKFAERIEGTLERTSIFDAAPGDSVIRVLAEWRRARGPGPITEYLTTQFERDPERALQLLRAVRPIVWGIESGVSHRGGIERNEFENLAFIMDPAILTPHLTALLGADAHTVTEYPGDDGAPDDMTLIKQFLWLHSISATSAQGSSSGAGEHNQGPA